METIFYYLETGEIISKQELSSILNGFSVARGKIGIVNKNQAVKINEGKIENVTSIENISSIIPKDEVDDVFTSIVNMHHAQAKNEQKAQIKKDELDRIIKENAYKKEKKAIRRKKTVKKIAIGTVLTAMVAISAVTVKYSQNYYKIANDTYDVLNSAYCYISNSTDTGKTYVAIDDHNELYGHVNPDYKEITTDSYNALHDVLVSQGYSNEEATVGLSTLIPWFNFKEFDTSSSLSEKIDYILNYDGINYTR